MRAPPILALCGAILALGCETRSATEDDPPRLEEVRPADATFTPGTSRSSPPTWVRDMRVTADHMTKEGLAIGTAQRPPLDRVAWLVYDPDLSPPNWIVSAAGQLPAEQDLLRAHIAYLRGRRHGPFTVGFTPEGWLIDEATGEKIARPLTVTNEGPNITVRLSVAAVAEWEQTELPLIGPIRFARHR